MALDPSQDRALCARLPGDGDLDSQRPLAARLDAGVGRFHEDGKVGLEQVRVVVGQAPGAR